MTASVIYHLLALDLEPWFFQAVDKLRRSFLWAGHSEANGGNCMVAWHLVCMPRDLGGLGLHNLRLLNTALCAKWVWISKTDSEKPWANMGLTASADALGLFNASVRLSVGDGASVLFWEDPWIGGLNVAAIAPAILAMVKPRFRRRRTVL
ncbi:hypothetical protein ACQ4PT_043026 [Festuca glaucescens]